MGLQQQTGRWGLSHVLSGLRQAPPADPARVAGCWVPATAPVCSRTCSPIREQWCSPRAGRPWCGQGEQRRSPLRRRCNVQRWHRDCLGEQHATHLALTHWRQLPPAHTRAQPHVVLALQVWPPCLANDTGPVEFAVNVAPREWLNGGCVCGSRLTGHTLSNVVSGSIYKHAALAPSTH